MIFYSEKNVYEAAKDRIRWIFDEFKGRRIVISFSGGKDSTTVLHLAKEIMDEKGIAKIPVFFCDQEVEAPQTIEYVREVMGYEWVEPYWIQSYFQEWNSSAGKWFNVWGPGENWVREKEPGNPYTDIKYDKERHFKDVLDSMMRYHFGTDYVGLGGVRIQESNTRRLGLTRSKCYKDITWGKNPSGNALVLYPIWDWGVNDVWYYIFSNRFSYCKLYNYYITKKPLYKCRVSSFIHENAIQCLSEIKEIAPGFYAKALNRVQNINTTVQTYSDMSRYVGQLPPYFESWDEYVVYLADHLIDDPDNASKMKKNYFSTVSRWERKIGKWEEGLQHIREVIGLYACQSIVAEDFEMSKLANRGLDLQIYINEHRNEIERANQEGI